MVTEVSSGKWLTHPTLFPFYILVDQESLHLRPRVLGGAFVVYQRTKDANTVKPQARNAEHKIIVLPPQGLPAERGPKLILHPDQSPAVAQKGFMLSFHPCIIIFFILFSTTYFAAELVRMVHIM